MNFHFIFAGIIIQVLASSCSRPQLAPELVPDKDAHWFKLPTEDYKGKQDDIHFVDGNLGFYVNGQGKIYRSQDGGLSWQLSFHQSGTYFRAIGMVDAQHGFVGNIGTEYFPGVTDTHPLYETHDGGSSWKKVGNLPGPPVKGICAIDIIRTKFIDAGVLKERTLIHAGGRVGGPAYLLRSLDGGRNWQNIDLSRWAPMVVDVQFFDEMNGIVFAGTDSAIEKSRALIIATQDGGVTWKKVYEGKRHYELTWKGSFPTRTTGYATIQNYNPDQKESQRWIVKTTDGGKTWIELPLVNDAGLREFGIGFANSQLGWVGTNKGGFETRDGGQSWKKIQLGRHVNKIRILPQDQGFIGFAIGADVYKFAPAMHQVQPDNGEVMPLSKP